MGRSEGGDAALATGASDALAGGIGKLAEVLAEAIAGILCPETEQQRAARLAEAKQKEQRQTRAGPGPATTPAARSFSFDTFFNEHGERLRREHEEWWQKRREQNRVRER